MPNYKFDVERVTEQLNRILQMELAGVIPPDITPSIKSWPNLWNGKRPVCSFIAT
jgi:hypothetical protein